MLNKRNNEKVYSYFQLVNSFSFNLLNENSNSPNRRSLNNFALFVVVCTHDDNFNPI